tara:strand:+ start:12398 stop:13810 length:1413 start_codon:yes stop_codon:yes gene_type:complete
MRFSDIPKILKNTKIIGKLNKKKINYITDHSDDATPSTLLVIDKKKQFKKKYLQKSISNGLTAIITNIEIKNILVTQIIVDDLEKNLRKLINFRQSFKPKKTIAITGTNGKTSSAWYLAQICKFNNISTKLTGTLGYYSNLKKIKDSLLTTPSNLDLYQFFYSNKKNKYICISEASSHGLHQGRFNNLNIDIAAITNISHDHLDYHKTFKSYVKSKFLLFTKILNRNGTAILNSRIKNYKYLKQKLKSYNLNIITYGSKDVYFKSRQNLSLFVKDKEFRIKKMYLNNMQRENLECAIACALTLNISVNKIIKSLHKLKTPGGRFEEIYYKKKSSKIVIDFAHTPDAIKNLLITYTNEKNKPSIVFGCGGERDKDKRKKIGIIVQKYANKVYLTDDNPRNENPKLIRKAIKKYCPKSIEIPSRRDAIFTAISKIEKNDVVIIAGKGHEKYQLIKNKKIKFDDYQIAKNCIK